MSKVLHLNEARQHTLSAGPKHLLRLVPGRNVVDDELFEAVLAGGKKEKVSRLQEMIDAGIVKVHGESLDITKMKAEEAIDVVELETTVEGLEDLLTQEESNKKPRKSVVEAIEAKLDSIVNPPDPSADKE